VKKEETGNLPELKKLTREQLLRIMLSQSRTLDHLRAELASAKEQLDARERKLSGVSDLAAACAALNSLEAAVQDTAEQYLENIFRSCAGQAANAGRSAEWAAALEKLNGAETPENRNEAEGG